MSSNKPVKRRDNIVDAIEGSVRHRPCNGEHISEKIVIISYHNDSSTDNNNTNDNLPDNLILISGSSPS